MIHLVSFFWKRIFPIALIGLAVAMALRDNYIASLSLLGGAALFWKFGGKLMTGFWHKWMKISLWLFILACLGLLATGYYLYWAQ